MYGPPQDCRQGKFVSRRQVCANVFVNKGEGVVKGRDFLTAAMSNASIPRSLGTRARAGSHRINYGGVFSTNHQYGHDSDHDSSMRTPGLCWVRERLLSLSVWLALTRIHFQAALDERTCGYGFCVRRIQYNPNRQLARGSYFGDDEVLLMTAVRVLLAEVRIEPHRDISCLDQEKTA